RDDAVGVQVVAGSLRRVPVRPGIADAPVGEIELGIVRAREPPPRAAVLPRVAAAFPTIRAGLVRRRDRVEAPRLLARCRIERRDEAADAVFAAGHADDHLV